MATKRTGNFLKDLKAKIKVEPTKSMRTLAEETTVTEGTIRRAVNDLGLTNYVHCHCQLLTEAIKKKSFEKGKKLLSRMKKEPGSTVQIFSDKKALTMDQVRNSRNDRWLAKSPKEVPPINKTKFSASVMMLSIVASDGKRIDPHWFEKGVKVNTEECVRVFETVVEPWLAKNYPMGGYIFQQDSAPSYKSRKTQELCKEHLAGF